MDSDFGIKPPAFWFVGFCRALASFNIAPEHPFVGVGSPNPLDEATLAPTKSWIRDFGIKPPEIWFVGLGR